jgi:hypothetical protein
MELRNRKDAITWCEFLCALVIPMGTCLLDRCKCGREFRYKCGAVWGKCVCFPANTVQPLQPRGLNNPANGTDIGFNPVQSPNLQSYRLRRALDQLLMEPPDKKTELPPPYQNLEKETRNILEGLKNLEKKMKQQGYISDSSDSDTDSDTDSTS